MVNLSTAAVSLIIIDVFLIIAALIYLILSQKKIRELEQRCRNTLDQTVDQVANKTFDGFVGEAARLQMRMIEEFNMLVLAQAQKSFNFAVIYSLAGILFFFTFLFLRQPQDPPLVSAVGSIVLELLSGANFYLYGRASRQMAQCHVRLFKAQNFLLSISVCKDFTDAKREEICAKIALIIANYSENMSEVLGDEGKEQRTKIEDRNTNGSQHAPLHAGR